MNITTAKWVDAGHTAIQINGNLSVPVDRANRDYREVKAWIDAGGIVTEYVAPVAALSPREKAIEALLVERAGQASPPKDIADYVNTK